MQSKNSTIASLSNEQLNKIKTHTRTDSSSVSLENTEDLILSLSKQNIYRDVDEEIQKRKAGIMAHFNKHLHELHEMFNEKNKIFNKLIRSKKPPKNIEAIYTNYTDIMDNEDDLIEKLKNLNTQLNELGEEVQKIEVPDVATYLYHDRDTGTTFNAKQRDLMMLKYFRGSLNKDVRSRALRKLKKLKALKELKSPELSNPISTPVLTIKEIKDFQDFKKILGWYNEHILRHEKNMKNNNVELMQKSMIDMVQKERNESVKLRNKFICDNINYFEQYLNEEIEALRVRFESKLSQLEWKREFYKRWNQNTEEDIRSLEEEMHSLIDQHKHEVSEYLDRYKIEDELLQTQITSKYEELERLNRQRHEYVALRTTVEDYESDLLKLTQEISSIKNDIDILEQTIRKIKDTVALRSDLDLKKSILKKLEESQQELEKVLAAHREAQAKFKTNYLPQWHWQGLIQWPGLFLSKIFAQVPPRASNDSSVVMICNNEKIIEAITLHVPQGVKVERVDENATITGSLGAIQNFFLEIWNRMWGSSSQVAIPVLEAAKNESRILSEEENESRILSEEENESRTLSEEEKKTPHA